MSLSEDIRRDLNTLKKKSTSPWMVFSDSKSPGWVEVLGPCFSVSACTIATDLNGEDYVARHAEARRIARLPDLERAYLDLHEVAKAVSDTDREMITQYDNPDPEVWTRSNRQFFEALAHLRKVLGETND